MRTILLGKFCGCILYGEYRLTVKGLIFAIPAALFFGASNSLSRSLEASSGTGSSSAKAKAMFYCSGLTITAIWAIFEGSTLEALRALRLEYTFLLATNVFSTAVAIVLGNSVLFPLDISSQPVHLCFRNYARVLLVLTGVIGCGSAVMLRRSYTTFLQLCAFLAAMLCIQVDAILDLFRQFGRDAYRRSLLLPPLPDTNSELCPNSPTSDVPAGTLCSGLQEGFSRVIRSLIVSVLMVASLWIIFVLLNFSESLHMHRGPVNAAPVLDLAYSPSIPTEIVISMYKEPIDSVVSLISSLRNLPNLSNSRVHIYTKDETADTNGIQHRTGANNMTKLPNIGREGETYLYHILSQWDSLAKHTLFIQGSVHNSHEFFARVHAFFDPDRTGMLSLGFPGHLCNCDDCGDEWGWKDAAGLVPQLYSRVYTASPPCSKALLSYKGQFIASAKRIRGLDKAVHRELREALVDEHSWAHQEKYLDGREDSMSAPDLGYTLERLWNVLLQCSDLDVAWKCPSLLSGKRWGGGMEDCQCFDG